MTSEQIQAKSDASKKEGFRRWMQEPTTRTIISTIPQCDNLEILLESAFNHGHTTGEGTMAVVFAEIMFRENRR